MKLFLKGREVADAQVEGVDPRDHTDLADVFISHAVWADTGEPLTDQELDLLTTENPNFIYEEALDICRCHADFYAY